MFIQNIYSICRHYGIGNCIKTQCQHIYNINASVYLQVDYIIVTITKSVTLLTLKRSRIMSIIRVIVCFIDKLFKVHDLHFVWLAEIGGDYRIYMYF